MAQKQTSFGALPLMLTKLLCLTWASPCSLVGLVLGIALGLIWVIFSPIALLMALISTVESLSTYCIQVAAFGLWSDLGVLSGFATMASAAWARRLQSMLLWIAVA